MRNAFYSRLAVTNLRKNKSTYFPYLLSSTVVIAMFYIIHALQQSASMSTFYQSDNMANILSLGSWVVALFSLLILFYTNGFLIKRRKKELGLYSILGMEKKHIGRVLALETIFVGLLSLLLGVASGILLSKLVYLLLVNLTGIELGLVFSVPLSSILLTCALFLGVFLLTLLNNLRQIHVSNPIALLQGGRQGEREPKTKWVLAILGLLFLGGGYVLTLTVANPYDAVSTFFVAVLLVIIGTYALFIAGSIVVLKLLRRNKRFYYHPRNFIPISGMLYRMKQNAAGLASICILSTIVLVILSSTVSLYVGQTDILNRRYPRQITTTAPYTGEIEATIKEAAASAAKTYGVTPHNESSYRAVYYVAVKEAGYMNPDPQGAYQPSEMYQVTLIPLEDYNRLMEETLSLNPGEVYLYTNLKEWRDSSLRLGGTTYRVRGVLAETPRLYSNLITQQLQVVVPSLDDMEAVSALLPPDTGEASYYYNFDLEGTEENIAAFCENYGKHLADAGLADCKNDDIFSGSESFLNTFGSLFFIGIFLGLLFLLATVLIIYYKQISEGYDDHDRFEIMQKVGLSRQEVKKTIHKQILMVFFLPLLTAVVHVLVAFHIISMLLMAFGMTDTGLFFLCTLGTVLVFALVYFLVYAVTAKAYYRLVERRN